jgi:hypothetical protein
MAMVGLAVGLMLHDRLRVPLWWLAPVAFAVVPVLGWVRRRGAVWTNPASATRLVAFGLIGMVVVLGVVLLVPLGDDPAARQVAWVAAGMAALMALWTWLEPRLASRHQASYSKALRGSPPVTIAPSSSNETVTVSRPLRARKSRLALIMLREPKPRTLRVSVRRGRWPRSRRSWAEELSARCVMVAMWSCPSTPSFGFGSPGEPIHGYS